MARKTIELLNHIKSRKLPVHYFGHVMRQVGDTIEGNIMIGLVKGLRSRGRPRICWLDNITAWTGLSGAGLFHAI